MRRAISCVVHQSGFASPGASSALRPICICRLELVTVPSFSGHAAAYDHYTALGFIGLAIYGSFVVLVLLEATNRAVQRGITRPARECVRYLQAR